MAAASVQSSDQMMVHSPMDPGSPMAGDIWSSSSSAAGSESTGLPKAFVTMLTTSAYLPGVLVLLHSLQELHPAPRDFAIVCLVTPETVDARTIGIVRDAGYDLVIGVEPIASGAAGRTGLNLMGRPDLDLALTKLHIFRLGQLFSSIVYLDADTLPLKPLSHLFDIAERYTMSACPDSGWPDCFNSGVMVVRPHLSDFENLQELLRLNSANDGEGNGSFDGADQGLLNMYFSDEGKGQSWNRLPFTYNVTPSAAYQYIPAYKHYKRNINLVHFIGSRKPWTRLANRPAGSQSASESSKGYDYEHLIDRWYAVYDRYVRPTAAHEPNLAKRFAVPHHIAVWDLEDSVGHSDRLDLAALKTAAARGVSSLQTGQYTSLPLEGRIDLMMPKGGPATDVEPASVSDNSPTTSASPAAIYDKVADSEGAWDAAWQPPPKHGGPEMSSPMTASYSAAWDDDPRSQSTYYQTHSDDTTFPTLPANVQNSDWYETFTKSTPDPANVRPLFPWEETGRPHARRTFPRVTGTPPIPVPAQVMDTRQVKSSTQSSLPSISDDVVIQPESHVPFAEKSFSEAMSSYTNAWDNIASIERYAKRLTKIGVAAEQRPQDGLQTVPPSPRRNAVALQGRDTDTASDGSADGDDEDDTDYHHAHHHHNHTSGKGSYRRHSGYRDKNVQTDKPRLNDATAQTVLQASHGTTTPQLRRARPSNNDWSVRQDSHRGAVVSRKDKSGRVWDPKTDIETRRKDSQSVLSRFMQG